MIDLLSAATVAIFPYDYASPLSQATGFILRSGQDRLYLITNYHVAAGRHPVTNEPLAESRSIPDRLLITLFAGATEKGPRWTPLVIGTKHVNGVSWVEHPVYGRQFDVVAIPLPLSVNQYQYSIRVGPQPDILIRPSTAVSVIGFPLGICGSGAFPIWKSGAIASEPELLIGGEDFFWIDCNSRTGMSGSPVVARRFGAHLAEDGGYSVGNGIVDRLLGVYAGRAFNSSDVTLGRVWRYSGLREIVRQADLRFNAEEVKLTQIQLGHFSEPTMPTISNSQFPFNGEVTRTSHLVAIIALADHRFGAGIDRVRIAAKILASCEAAESQDSPIDITSAEAALLLESLQQPIGWQFNGWVKFLPLVESLIDSLQNAANPS